MLDRDSDFARNSHTERSGEEQMTSDDETLRKTRAQRLREQIKQLLSPKDKTEPESKPEEKASETEVPKSESPRDFIHRKMRKSEDEAKTSNSSEDKG